MSWEISELCMQMFSIYYFCELWTAFPMLPMSCKALDSLKWQFCCNELPKMTVSLGLVCGIWDAANALIWIQDFCKSVHVHMCNDQLYSGLSHAGLETSQRAPTCPVTGENQLVCGFWRVPIQQSPCLQTSANYSSSCSETWKSTKQIRNWQSCKIWLSKSCTLLLWQLLLWKPTVSICSLRCIFQSLTHSVSGCR